MVEDRADPGDFPFGRQRRSATTCPSLNSLSSWEGGGEQFSPKISTMTEEADTERGAGSAEPGSRRSAGLLSWPSP